jgi:putative peptidoglycan lipid II flippase
LASLIISFATLAAEKALDKMRTILVDMLRLILFLSFPATMLLIVLRRPMVSFLFERGQFDEQSTSFVAWALLFFALSLVALATIEILSRAFYALEDTWTPVIVGALQLVAMWLIGSWLAENIFPELGFRQFGGLALGYSISTLLEVGLLFVLANRKLNGLDNRRLLDGLWRMALATIFMGIVCWFVLDRLADLGSLWQLVVVGIVALLSYLLASIALHINELNQLISQIQRRLVKR